jgi:hypothetical protein
LGRLAWDSAVREAPPHAFAVGLIDPVGTSVPDVEGLPALPAIQSQAPAPFPLPELALRCGVAPGLWREIETRAARRASDPYDLAIAEDLIAEKDFIAALAAMHGLIWSLAPPAPDGSQSAGEIAAFRAYFTRQRDGSRIRVVAPGGSLAALLQRHRRAGTTPALILTTRQVLIDRAVEADSAGLAEIAATGLPARFSARNGGAQPRGWPARIGRLAVILGLPTMLGSLALIVPPAEVVHTAMVLLPLLLTPLFLTAALAALTATVESGGPGRAAPPVARAELPRYSILVPLYREANIMGDLVVRLSRLIYPRERLEALLLVEADDYETAAALATTALPPWMTIVRVPPGQPRTKPRAISAGLPLATGDLLVVFDAEDAPEPDQLLRAAALFRAAPADVACLQARLAVSNARDGLLARRFAIDYATLFDCFKPGIARAGWPITLGGSSNHFRVPALRQVGGWDAWNVTEDADLGIRLARLGWKVEDLASTTWEEAPNTLRIWMNQRTRWLKGWLQTFAVHIRSPRALVADLGPFRALITVAMGFAVLAGATLYPVLAAAVLWRIADPTPFGSGSMLLSVADAALIAMLGVAVLVEIVPAVIALKRRKALRLLPYVLLAPLTHLLVSAAMWRAMIELIRRPYHWHKTPHGRARHEDRAEGSFEAKP